MVRRTWSPAIRLAANDPCQGATHLNDIIVIAPIFHGKELIAYAANLAHHVDVGGAQAGSLAASTEIYQEGLVLPIVKITTAASAGNRRISHVRRQYSRETRDGRRASARRSPPTSLPSAA